jgi:hypothetical protein
LKLSRKQIVEVPKVINLYTSGGHVFHSCEIIPDPKLIQENYGIHLIIFYFHGIRTEVRVDQAADISVDFY